MNNKLIYGVLIATVLLAGGYFLFRNQEKAKNTTSPQNNVSTQNANVESNGDCSGKLTPQLTEGPYYESNSPQRINLVEEGIPGEKLTLTGFIFDQDCKVIEGAWLDFWQADGEGSYDNSGFKLRGHQFSGSDGRYILETVVPGEYPGRTPHIHVKVKASENSPVITSQLFLPGASQNQTDSIFNEALVIKMENSESGKVGTFNFVVNKSR